MSYLSVEQLSIHFGGLRAVDNVTFALQEGQIHGLIGPNGAGKTTIFNCITGFYHPTTGTIRFRDQDITHLRPDQIARRGIARTFQNVQLFRSMSALDNVLVAKHSHMRTGVLAEAFALPFVHQQERMVREQAQAILAFLDLAHVQRQAAGHLPLGLQKRLELGRALALDLHSALHTKGTVCSGLRTALLVSQSRRPVRAAEAIDVGLSGGALRQAF